MALYIGGTAVDATAAELNIMDGVTSTAAELNLLDGETALAPGTLTVLYRPINASEDEATTTQSYGYMRMSGFHEEDQQIKMCGFAPVGITGVSAMKYCWIGTHHDVFAFSWGWSIAADDENHQETTQASTTTMTDGYGASVTAYDMNMNNLMNETGSNDFEDVIAAEDAFGITVMLQQALPQQTNSLGVAITWTF